MGRTYLMPEQHEPEFSASLRPASTPPNDAAPEPLTQTPMAASPSTTPHTPQRIPYWLQQVERFLRVIVRIYLGLLVCFAPWYPPAWQANPLFAQPAGLHAFISLGAVRGIVSGLGLLNLWIALREALGSNIDPDA